MYSDGGCRKGGEGAYAFAAFLADIKNPDNIRLAHVEAGYVVSGTTAFAMKVVAADKAVQWALTFVGNILE